MTASATVTVANPPPPAGVYTYKYDNGRTGLNPNESKLTVAAVTNGTNFGKLGTWTVDGSIYTQPLYVPGVSINSGTYNVLYVGTENDSVYALNADVPGSVLWKRSFLTSTATIGTRLYGRAHLDRRQCRHHRHAGHRSRQQLDVRRHTHHRGRQPGAAPACHRHHDRSRRADAPR